MHPRLRRPIYALLAWTLLLALLGSWLWPARPAHAAMVPLAITPGSLNVPVQLGGTRHLALALTNTTDAPLTSLIYKALPASTGQVGGGPAVTLRRTPLPPQAERLDPRLLAAWQSAPDQRADIVVYLREQADLSAAYAIQDWAERGRYVYQTLAEHATRTQTAIRGFLQTHSLPYRAFWVVNALRVHAGWREAQWLAGRSEVALVRADTTLPLAPDPAATEVSASLCSPDEPANPVCWNIRQIGADRVWRDFGVSGQGIVVASIDTGVRYDHVALAAQYRGALAGGAYNHNYSWFDPHGVTLAPDDPNGHGTHTLGTMVAAGNGTLDQPSVGVAPGARWITAQGCSTSACSESDLIASAQWLLAPTMLDGTHPRPDLRPMVVNNSWAGAGGQNWYAGYTAAWRAAGIFPVFAAGNAGVLAAQTCGSVASPADYADVVAVGATDQQDHIANFSLLGPAGDGRIKPDVVAPGTSLLSTSAAGETSYQTLQGTSMAAPHVAGLVALLWSANPALIGDYDTTYAILRASAHLRSDTRCQDPDGAPNNVYGYGRIDAYAAIAQARVEVPWLDAPTSAGPIAPGQTTTLGITLDAHHVTQPGIYRARLQFFGTDLGQAPTTVEVAMHVLPAEQQLRLTGRVIGADSGAGLAARVTLDNGLAVSTDSSGVYTMTLTPGVHQLEAEATAYFPARRPMILTETTRLADIVLQPDQPRLSVATAPLSTSLEVGQQQTITIPISNTGTVTLSYHLELPADQFGIWRSDEPGGPAYSWVDLPRRASTLVLTDTSYAPAIPLGIVFPFFEQIYTRTLISPDGMLSFSGPPQGQYSQLMNACMPGWEDMIRSEIVAPFRADLDLSSGSRVRYGALDATTFVVSYEDLVLHDGPPDATYTFQVLLHSDGRITFQYQQLGPLPSMLSVGVQRGPGDGTTAGCGITTPVSAGLALELRPQPAAPLWLAGGVSEGQLAPGAQGQITATLTWVHPILEQQYRAAIEVSSSDPISMSVRLPLRVAMRPAPYELRLPLVGEGVLSRAPY